MRKKLAYKNDISKTWLREILNEHIIEKIFKYLESYIYICDSYGWKRKHRCQHHCIYITNEPGYTFDRYQDGYRHWCMYHGQILIDRGRKLYLLSGS